MIAAPISLNTLQFRTIDEVYQEIAEIAIFEPEVAGSMHRTFQHSNNPEDYRNIGEYVQTYHTMLLLGDVNERTNPCE